MTDIKFTLAAVAAVVAGPGIMATAAHATTYDWTISSDDNGTPFTSSGTFVDTDGIVTAFSGTWDGVDISGVADVDSFNGNDNAYPLQYFYDTISFNLASALPGSGTQVALNDGYGSITWTSNGTDDSYDTSTFTATPVGAPEPASLALLGSGVAGLLAAGARRRGRSAA